MSGAAYAELLARASASDATVVAQLQQIGELEGQATQLQAMLRAADAGQRTRRAWAEFLERRLANEGVDVPELKREHFGGGEGAGGDAHGASGGGAPSGSGGGGEELGPLEVDGDGVPLRVDPRVRRYYEGEHRRLQKAAQQTIRNLKDLMAKKTRLLTEYQDKIEAMRKEREAERCAAAAAAGAACVSLCVCLCVCVCVGG